MASFHGKAGSITWSGTATESEEITSWSLDATCDTAESTNMASSDDYKTYIAGFKDWTATIEAILNATVSDLTMLGTSGDLVLNTGTATLSAAGICTSLAYSVDANDVGKVTYSFQGNGEIT